MLRNKQVGFVGSGNMGEALVNGLLHGRLCRPEQILCSDVRPEKLKVIREKYGVKGYYCLGSKTTDYEARR
jgi:pyrroline-5-carboxylate reductase